MRADHVMTNIFEKASGPAMSVPRLCESIGVQNVDVRLHVLAPADDPGYANVRLLQYPRWPWIPRLAASPALFRALKSAARECDLIHNHGLWEMTNIYPGEAIRGTRCRLISSPRGTLLKGARERSSFRKTLMWHYAQERTFRASACLHATSDAEAAALKTLGYRIPIAMVPNGIDIPRAEPAPSQGYYGCRRLLCLARIHPIKRIDVLLRSWSQIESEFLDWELVLAGPDNEGYLKQMMQLASELALKRVTFAGAIFGEEKERLFQAASLYVLPTRTENFGMTVAEALAAGVPVIVTKGAPWAKLDEQRCGWWIDHGEGPLVECLRHALSLPPESLREAGLRGRDWMKRDFDWGQVGRMMHETYLWVLGGGNAPAWVQEGR